LSELSGMNSEFLAGIVKDKIIVVGDYQNDQFDSYVGKISGPLVLLNAFLSLKHKDPFLSWQYLLFLLLVFMVLSYYILKPQEIVEDGSKIRKVNSLLKPLKLVLAITIITLISYLVFDKYISFFFITLYVLVLDYLIRFIYNIAPKIKKLMQTPI
jgi:hypothetical protein